jgi:UDP-glucose 4-epimerase
MTVLVTGGAGYIGSHMTHALLDRGEKVVVLDNLSTGVRALVPPQALFIEGSVADPVLVGTILREHGIDAVVHFAGSVVVPDSVADPLAYYDNNTIASRNLIACCVAAGVRHFIFSSTAAVYGEGIGRPVPEEAPTLPINPYGRSKLMTEWMLADTALAHDFRHVALRYFNVAGADPKGRTGQSTPRATHLIKRACQVALGRYDALDIFGTDYPTPDGTGIRDYIHIADLVIAHVLALDYLRGGGRADVFNCGYGHGASVREVIAAVEEVSGKPLPVRHSPRRVGDPPALVANSAKLKAAFLWKPEFDDLRGIVQSAYAWEQKQ